MPVSETARRRVTTQTAVYDIDLIRNVIRRRPMNESSSEDWDVRENRCDGEWMQLITFVQLEVGKSFQFACKHRLTPAGHVTIRLSTPVQKIEFLD